MIDREINERIAGALGWVLCEHIQAYRPWYGARDCDFVPVRDFSPATSVDALRKWVLPYLEGKMLMYAFSEALWERWNATGDVSNEFGAFLLTSPPATLAAAALAVLEEDNAVN